MKLPTLTLEAAAFICAFEGFVPECYDDGGHAGAGNCTIGFGHLVHYGPTSPRDRRRWGTITRAQGVRLFMHDATPALYAIERTIRVKLTDPQVGALCSFAFNCGGGALDGPVGRAVNSKPRFWQRTAMRAWHRRVGDALLEWDHVGGVVNEGLRRRRQAEAMLFATGAYTRTTGNPYANS